MSVPTDNRRRVLYLQSNSEIGGSDVCLLRMVEALDRSRFDPLVVLPSDGPLTGALRERGASLFILREMMKLTTRKGKLYYLRYLYNYPKAVGKILRIIRGERIDVVHSNTLHNLHGFLAARLARRPHVWHVREIVLQSRFFRRLELALARRYADRVVAMSGAIAEAFRDGGAPPPRQLRIIPDGIDTERFHPRNSGDRIRSELGIEAGAPVVGLVCRLDHWKGVEVFLRAAAVVRSRLPEARYLVVGGPVEGQEKFAARMIGLAGALGLDGFVHFTGWRYGPGDMPEVHAALDVLVLASTWPEPFGLVLLEAMATGRPVVATRHGGPVEICAEGETALLVPPRDADAMADTIVALLRDPHRARSMGAAGRARVLQLFDHRRYGRELQLLYEEVLMSPGT
ncbi:MAG TPA: glycosyltransferase family 4 protein [Pyrinomonadaceae bacterium]|nr:glycosyltransferase family 4 protein [Pyrinomonadaceae bacterium]